jgi:hypothetical protein
MMTVCGDMPIIPATQEVVIGGLWFETNLGKKLAKSYVYRQARIIVHVCNPNIYRNIMV